MNHKNDQEVQGARHNQDTCDATDTPSVALCGGDLPRGQAAMSRKGLRAPLRRRRPCTSRGEWSYRRRPKIEPAADIFGRSIGGAVVRRNGRPVFVPDLKDPLVPGPDAEAPSRLPELRRRVTRELERYRETGIFSDFELRLMRWLFDGKSANAFAVAEGVSRQAIDYHIRRLEFRAPLFRRFWRAKNLMRRRR